jgi:hypothetical protein
MPKSLVPLPKNEVGIFVNFSSRFAYYLSKSMKKHLVHGPFFFTYCLGFDALRCYGGANYQGLNSMRFSLLGIWLIALPLFATAQTVSLKNDREGVSFYSNRANNRAINRALKEVSEQQIQDALDEVLKNSQASQLCSYDLNQDLLENLQRINPKFKEMNGAIYYLRSINDIDDSVAKILLDAHKTVTTNPRLPKDPQKLVLPQSDRVVEMLPVIASFKTKHLKSSCFDEAYQSMYYEIQKLDKDLKSHHMEALLVEALQQKLIDVETYLSLEKARLNELELSGLTLKAYYQKISSLRKQYPLRDPLEQSNFVTEKVDKMKIGRRQRLLETYSDLQIIMMGNVIKKLRARLESPKAEILIYDLSAGIETITLEPMERFGLAIKLLRKEMSYIALNTYFDGRSPDYMDLMVAAYETGIIPSTELDELAGLQDLWNPKKTFWDKARIWVQTLSTVATIVIPPPYGFVPALAIVVIEATAGKKNNTNAEDPTSLF